MSDDGKAFADVWNEKKQAYVLTDITQGIRCANHGGLNAAEVENLATTDCVECGEKTHGGDKVIMHERVEGGGHARLLRVLQANLRS
jgi:hypothetical protein